MNYVEWFLASSKKLFRVSISIAWACDSKIYLNFGEFYS